MFDFNSDEFNILIAQDIPGASLGLTSNLENDIISPQTSKDSPSLSTELDETLILRGTKDFDFLTGKDSHDTLYGLAGNDLLNGGAGDDIINGGTDKDWLFGAKGNDILIDGDGGDLMIGGKNADIFWINNWDIPETPSTILDFNIAEDTIKIGRLGVTFDSLTFEEDSSSTTIYDNGKPLAELIDIDKDSLSAESFIFGDAALANELQTNLEQVISTSETPGATQAIITADGFTWEGAAGFSNKDAQTPMQPSDIFSIASTTKAFTGATVLKVVESGKISLDDTLGEYLPEIAKNIPYGEEITLRQLLNGSSGIPSFDDTEKFLTDLKADTFADKSPEEIVAYVYGEPLFSGLQSTSIWAYTNTADIIASLMIEEATGKAFGDLMQENVIEPLGLDNTTYGIPEQIPENLARSYTDIFDASDDSLGFDGIVEDVTEFDVRNLSVLGAAGALFSNAEDVARFTQALFGGELLTQDSLNELTNFVDVGDGSRYGLGVLEAPDTENFSKGKKWQLIGDAFGYGSRTLYLPDDGGSINTVLANFQNRSEVGVKSPAASILVSSNKVLIDDFSKEEVAMN